MAAFEQWLRSSETEAGSPHCEPLASTGKPLMVPLVLATHESCIPSDSRSLGRPAHPGGSRSFSGTTEGVPKCFLHSGDHTGKPILAARPRTQACLGTHHPHFPHPCEAYLPQLRAKKGAWVGPPSPWVGNYATFCLPNQKHALGKGGEGNFVIGFN